MSEIAEATIAQTLARGAYSKPGGRRLVYILLLAAVAAVFLGELTIGVVPIPLRSIVSVLFGNPAERVSWTPIVMDLRLPRALTALIAGAGLGVSGLLMQTLFRNPLASPWTLGLAAGAELGVAVVVMLAGAVGASVFAEFGFLGNLSMAVAAGLGSTLVLLAILSIAQRVSAVTLLIAGLMLHYLLEGFVNLLLHFTTESQVRVFESWYEGSFANLTWTHLKILVPVVIAGLIVAQLMVKMLNALLLGNAYARSLGVSVGLVRTLAMVSTAALAGAVTAYCGPIVFLGVAVPHLCRGLLNTSDHRTLMPAVMLLGSLLALTADLITHLRWGFHFLHLNTVNALIGAPVVLWVILRRRNASSLEL
jgi:iron complex transport system permease protein